MSESLRRVSPHRASARALRCVAFASLIASAVALGTFEILSVDFGWHIKAGELIWAAKSIPTRDVFSYIAEGRPWVDSHWLFQLTLYGVHEAVGIPGLYALRVLLLVATFGFLLASTPTQRHLPLSLAICLLALLAAYPRFELRPELVSLCLLAAFGYGLANLAERPRFGFAFLPLAQLVWTNAHGLAILGVGLIALHVAGDVAHWLLARAGIHLAEERIETRVLRRKLALFGVALLTFLANANGARGIAYPFEIFGELRGEVAVYPSIEELASPLSVEVASALDPILAYGVLVGVSALSWLAAWRRFRLADALVYLAFLYLSVLAVRNASLFAIVAAPIAIRNFAGALDRARAARPASPSRERAVALASALAMLSFAALTGWATSSNWLYEQLGSPRRFGVGLADRFAEPVVDELAVLDGRFFNSPDLGGYLIWKLYPKKQVAVDGRWEVYGDLMPEIQRAFGDPQTFARLVERYEITAVVLGTRTPPAIKMARWLRRSRGWHLTAHSESVLLFERIERIAR